MLVRQKTYTTHRCLLFTSDVEVGLLLMNLRALLQVSLLQSEILITSILLMLSRHLWLFVQSIAYLWLVLTQQALFLKLIAH